MPSAESARDRIEQTLAGMTTAAQDADVGKYMTHVDPDRPLLLAEQRAWATFLRTSRPTELRFAITENAEITLADDGLSATTEVLLAWTPPADPEHPDTLPEPISVVFPALFEPMHDPEVIADTRWVFAGVDWEVTLTAADGSSVLAMEADRDRAKWIAEMLPMALESAAACFEADQPTSTVKLYPSLALLNASISPGLTSPIAGWNEPGESMKLAAPAMNYKAESVVLHEAAHVVQFTLGAKALEAPWWVLEGSAERAASLATDEGDRVSVNMTVYWWHSNNRIADFDDLAVYDEKMPAGSMRAYVQGHHFITFLDETFSTVGRNSWIKLLCNGATLDEASELIFQQKFELLDQSWRAKLDESASPDP